MIIKPYCLPKAGLSFYRRNTVINYFNANKSDFEYIVNNVQGKELFSIERVNGELIFKDCKLGVKQTSNYDNDEKLKAACNNIFDGSIPVKEIWIQESTDYYGDDIVAIRFEINSMKFTRKMQGIYYAKNTNPCGIFESKFINLDGYWYYFEEDGDIEIDG